MFELSNAVLVSLLIILISTALFLIVHKNAANVIPGHRVLNRDPTFIIAGPSGSGKTSLFNMLTTDSFKPTVMSQVPNVAEDYMLPSNVKSFKFKLMEFPGHVKLRYRLFDTLKESTYLKGLIFVVDSTIDPQKLTETAEFFYEILMLTERFPEGVDVMIACNKSESFSSRPPLKIRDALEKEIGKIIERKAKSLSAVKKPDKNLSGHDEDESNPNSLEFQGGHDFKFDALDGNIDALDGSVLKSQIDKWECWIDERSVN
ncbi:LANO_0H09560g1_1 [Lachancea nothofagi CBS 11611]|uniref:Signal recognition particle receptor subunit beta n=1 Tax=Lachancea nothofagi CBS 11611 TaxID=1266666 RepID=A0A1G4KLS9_9SACH|nr:LANO_0H09560g1_1 [Lachancea nothofagi CBS 11611]